MRKHNNERPFICPCCSTSFTQKGNLKTHIKRAHQRGLDGAGDHAVVDPASVVQLADSLADDALGTDVQMASFLNG